jgi:hypothetical protein
VSRFIYYYAECRYGEYRYGECRYGECRYDKCRGALENTLAYSVTASMTLKKVLLKEVKRKITPLKSSKSLKIIFFAIKQNI